MAEHAFTRVMVKGIPVHVDAQRLREHFAARGEVTDAKVLRTSDGRSRQIAFIGFKTSEQAAEAVRFFSRTFLDTSRLEVEARAVAAVAPPGSHPRPAQLAQPPGKSADVARPWSKYSAGSSRHTAALAAEAAAGAPAAAPATARAAKKAAAAGARRGAGAEPAEETDPQLAEFLALMQPRRAQKLWARLPASPQHTHTLSHTLHRTGG